MSDPASDPQGASTAVRLVRALMERHGLPRYRHSAWLADATGLSYSQAHRRMNGTSPWSLEDVERVAALFGETLGDLLGAGGAAGESPGAAVGGTVRVGDAELPCRLWLGEALAEPEPGSVVAVRTGSGWQAVPAAEDTRGAWRIDRLEARPDRRARRSVAVLDDDEDLTRSICAHLDHDGYAARPYFRTEDLPSGADAPRFDAYVVDWLVGSASTAGLVAALRARDARCPIVVLTAQVVAGVVDESEIADAVARHGLVFSEKPVRMSILSATLARAFAGAPG
jgi:ActR/RegA family two-component response regulator